MERIPRAIYTKELREEAVRTSRVRKISNVFSGCLKEFSQ
jgi:hypothetical protein